MPSPKPTQKKGKLSGRSMSFHDSRFVQAQSTAEAAVMEKLRRPKTVPNLPSASRMGGLSLAAAGEGGRPRLTKLLLKVTIQGNLGPVQVLMTPESTVGDLIAAAVKQYVKEGRRPVLPTSDPNGFDLHYSQFSLESLDRDEQLLQLGSRNFFLCGRKAAVALGSDGFVSPQANATNSPESCSKQAEKVTTPWLKFMSFLQ